MTCRCVTSKLGILSLVVTNDLGGREYIELHNRKSYYLRNL